MKEKIGPHPEKMAKTRGQVIDDDLWPAISSFRDGRSQFQALGPAAVHTAKKEFLDLSKGGPP